MNALHVRIVDSPSKAPNYKGGDFKGAVLQEAVIVKNGTTSGKPTVDLVFEVTDADGKTEIVAVAMTTGAIIQMLAATIKGTEERHG